MRRVKFLWDDSLGGNAEHIAEHGVSKKEVERVMSHPRTKLGRSKSSNRPIAFGVTRNGRQLVVIFEDYGGTPWTIYVITAYEPNE